MSNTGSILFDRLRLWAYANCEKYPSKNLFTSSLIIQAHYLLETLCLPEVRTKAEEDRMSRLIESVADWTWKRFGKEADFEEYLSALRGSPTPLPVPLEGRSSWTVTTHEGTEEVDSQLFEEIRLWAERSEADFGGYMRTFQNACLAQIHRITIDGSFTSPSLAAAMAVAKFVAWQARQEASEARRANSKEQS